MIWPELTTFTLLAPFGPKFTVVAPVKLLPVIVTLVPPPVGPEGGLTPVTAGTGTELTVAEPAATLCAPPASLIVVLV